MGKSTEKPKEQGVLYVPAVCVLLFFITHQIILLIKTDLSGLAILSNAVPFIYLIGIPYLMAGMLKRSKPAFYTGFLFLLLFVFQAFHINLIQSPAEEPTFAILTHNLQVNGSDKALLEKLITTHQPEVIFLQEVPWEYKTTQLDEFAEENGYFMAEKQNYSLVILSKTPLDFVPSQSTQENRVGYIFVKTTINEKEVLLVNVHNPVPWFDKKVLPVLGFPIWWYTDDFRNHRMDQLITDLDQHQNKTIIIAGDFNMNSFTVDYRKLSLYQDAFKTGGTGLGFTWPNARSEILRIPLTTPLFRLDYIFTTKDIRIHRTEKLAPTGSDHIPLLATVSLPTD